MTKFNFKFFFFSHYSKNYQTLQKALLPFFSPEKLAQLFFLKEVKPSPDNKMIKILTFENYMYCQSFYALYLIPIWVDPNDTSLMIDSDVELTYH